MNSPKAIVTLLLLLLCGCGTTVDYDYARLEGTVSVDGNPIAEGLVIFVPTGAGQGPGAKAEIVEGNYVCETVPLGQVRVTFSANQETGKMIERPEIEQIVPEVISLIPERYRSGIVIEVSGDEQKDFELSSSETS